MPQEVKTMEVTKESLPSLPMIPKEVLLHQQDDFYNDIGIWDPCGIL